MRTRVIRFWPFRHWANAVAFPPLAVFVKSSWWLTVGYTRRAKMIRHERVHWAQYQRMGLIRFYTAYIYGRLRYGYRDHPMEVEARAGVITNAH